MAGRLLGPGLYDLLADKALYLLDLRNLDLLLMWRGSVKITNFAARVDAASSIAKLAGRPAQG